MERYKGEEFILSIKAAGDTDFRLVACITSAPLSESSEAIGTTTRENDGWVTSLPTNQSYTIAVDGVMIRDGMEANGTYSYHELRKLKRTKQVFEWIITAQNGYNIDKGRAVITEISYTDEVDEWVTFSATLVGFGAPIETDARVRVLGTPNGEEIYTYDENKAIKA